MSEKSMLKLSSTLIAEANIVQTMIENSTSGLFERDMSQLMEVFRSEKKVNQMEVEIEEHCVDLITKEKLKEQDLRTILLTHKINNDIERIGDLAEKISESAQFLVEKPPVDVYDILRKMAGETISMFKDSVWSFTDVDIELAMSVDVRNRDVIRMNEEVIDDLTTLMVADPRISDRAQHLIKISQNLERIADIATYIAEDVITLIEGTTAGRST